MDDDPSPPPPYPYSQEMRDRREQAEHEARSLLDLAKTTPRGRGGSRKRHELHMAAVDILFLAGTPRDVIELIDHLLGDVLEMERRSFGQTRRARQAALEYRAQHPDASDTDVARILVQEKTKANFDNYRKQARGIREQAADYARRMLALHASWRRARRLVCKHLDLHPDASDTDVARILAKEMTGNADNFDDYRQIGINIRSHRKRPTR